MKELMEKAVRGEVLSKEDAVKLLEIGNHSSEFYELLAAANECSRKRYKDKGYVFAQIGINSAPCTGNCKFCSLAKDSFVVKQELQKSMDDILWEVEQAVLEGVDALFLMTTADYSVEKFLEVAREAKSRLKEDTMFIANIGDFDEATAVELKRAGFTGVYHIVRLGEEKDTDITREERIKTLDAIKAAKMDILYCVEPIGPEHTYEEIADEMIRAREYGVDIMACMKRVGVPGTPLYKKGEITDLELTKIAAVTRLVTDPKKSMNVHEPKQMTLLAGINQLYAEIGINPRDCDAETRENRGRSIREIKEMLREVDYICQ